MDYITKSLNQLKNGVFGFNSNRRDKVNKDAWRKWFGTLRRVNTHNRLVDMHENRQFKRATYVKDKRKQSMLNMFLKSGKAAPEPPLAEHSEGVKLQLPMLGTKKNDKRSKMVAEARGFNFGISPQLNTVNKSPLQLNFGGINDRPRDLPPSGQEWLPNAAYLALIQPELSEDYDDIMGLRGILAEYNVIGGGGRVLPRFEEDPTYQKNKSLPTGFEYDLKTLPDDVKKKKNPKPLPKRPNVAEPHMESSKRSPKPPKNGWTTRKYIAYRMGISGKSGYNNRLLARLGMQKAARRDKRATRGYPKGENPNTALHGIKGVLATRARRKAFGDAAKAHTLPQRHPKGIVNWIPKLKSILRWKKGASTKVKGWMVKRQGIGGYFR